ncbi:MAG: MOSC domain-containing protein [Cytophagales bacterium]|jgi:hypothetical protein|nr:MOSC domain-containing protein [Cytophagales bacterium]
MTQDLILSAIHVYPIKSLGGFAVDEARVEERGLQHDRRWMLVDADNRFLTQRTDPRMALLQVNIAGNQLIVSKKGGTDSVGIPLQPESNEPLRVTVFDDTCDAVTVSHEADDFFSDYLRLRCRLVYMPDSSIRPVDARYAVADNHTSFSDGYPFLLIGQASLDDLNSRLAEPLPMNRFRPNLVVTTAEPHAEDTWREIQIGETTFFGVKPCGRCVVTTTNQETAEVGKEPLRTLATYRKSGNKILFGQNLVFGRVGGRVRVGDAVIV